MKRLFIAALLGLAAAAAAAQNYPSKPIKMIAGTAPGGTVDKLARAIGKHLSERLGQPVVVENRPGAGGTMAAEAVAAAPPDGYTITIASAPTTVITPLLEKVRYDPLRDFQPVGFIGAQPYVLLVPPASKAQTVRDVLTVAKGQADGLSYSSAGRGTGGHLAGELLSQVAGVPMLHIPYKGVAPAINDVAGGMVSFTFATTGSSQGIVDSKKLRPLATTGSHRSKAYPGLPTMQEAGFADYEVSTWYGVNVPAKTPLAIVRLLNKELNLLLSDKKLQDDLESDGIELRGSTPEEFAAFQKAEQQRWRRVLAKGGLLAK